jgi:hypothetical protein
VLVGIGRRAVGVVDEWWCGRASSISGGVAVDIIGGWLGSTLRPWALDPPLGSSLRRWPLACAAQSYPSFSSFYTMGGGWSSPRSLRRVALPPLLPLRLFVSRFAMPVFVAIAVVHVVVLPLSLASRGGCTVVQLKSSSSSRRCRGRSVYCRTGAVSVSGEEMGKEVGKNEPRQKSWFVLGTHYPGLPLPGSPFVFLLPNSFVERA